MKTILVDAVHTFVDKEGNMNATLHTLLESYPNKKIILTNAEQEKMTGYGLDHVPYEVFSLEKNPPKTAASAAYYKTFLRKYDLLPTHVVYFEHNQDAVAEAQSIGIVTHWYDPEKKDILGVQEFLDTNL